MLESKRYSRAARVTLRDNQKSETRSALARSRDDNSVLLHVRFAGTSFLLVARRSGEHQPGAGSIDRDRPSLESRIFFAGVPSAWGPVLPRAVRMVRIECAAAEDRLLRISSRGVLADLCDHAIPYWVSRDRRDYDASALFPRQFRADVLQLRHVLRRVLFPLLLGGVFILRENPPRSSLSAMVADDRDRRSVYLRSQFEGTRGHAACDKVLVLSDPFQEPFTLASQISICLSYHDPGLQVRRLNSGDPLPPVEEQREYDWVVRLH